MAAHQERSFRGKVSNPDRLRVLCPDSSCPVMGELERLRLEHERLRLAARGFLIGGLAAGVALWLNSERGDRG